MPTNLNFCCRGRGAILCILLAAPVIFSFRFGARSNVQNHLFMDSIPPTDTTWIRYRTAVLERYCLLKDTIVRMEAVKKAKPNKRELRLLKKRIADSKEYLKIVSN